VIVGPALVAAGVAVRSATWVAVELAVQFLYFFALEAASGQTIGKRVFHVRVVSLDGRPITMRQAAIRNVLRFVDALPLLYASGMISMIRTGRAKRQRIGDVVAGTVLVVDPGGRPLRTPRWLLPVVTLVATALSIVLIVALLNAPQIGPPAGFTGDVSQPPAVGAWTATGTVTSSQGYGADPIGQPFVRSWSIARSCRTGRPCDYVMTRQVPGQAPERARLVLASDGWHGQLPTTLYVCGHTATGRAIYWPQVSVFVARFTDGGRTAEVNQRDLSYTPACGYGTHTVSWTATHS
jgi:hypothetical protein